jgi:hypothetical protein
MNPVTAVALVSALVFVLPRGLYQNRYSLLSYLIWAVASGTCVFVAIMLVGNAWGIGWAIALALPPDVMVIAVSARSIRRARRMRKAIALLEGREAKAALLALDGELSAIRAKGKGRNDRHYRHWAQWALHVGTHAYIAGHVSEALRWCGAIDDARLSRELRGARAQAVAAFRLASGDTSGARNELARAPRPATPRPFEEALVAMEALLDALGPNAEGVIPRAEQALSSDIAPHARSTWRVALAHALASLGSRDEAREQLRIIQRDAGTRALERAVAHRGPASDIAVSLLRERPPYR